MDGATTHKILPGKQLICLGDMSTIGNFLALQQLAGTGGRNGSGCRDSGRDKMLSVSPYIWGILALSWKH